MTESQQTEELKRYLFYEMSDEESESLEEKYYENAELFNELVGLETDLIDCYAIGKLNGTDLQRFEKSLEKSPERRKKIADARIFQKLIAEEKAKLNPIVIVAPTFWEKLSEYFKISTSGLKLAAGTLVILLICTAAFLLYQNWQKQNEYADIERQKRLQIELDEKENRQKDDLEELNRIEEENKNITNENSSIDSTQNQRQQNRENELRKRIEERNKEIEVDREKLRKPPIKQKEIKPRSEVLAVNVYSIIKGDTGKIFNPTAKVDKINGEKKIILSIPVPLDKDYSSIKVISRNKGNFITYSEIIAKGAKTVVFYLPPIDSIIQIQGTKRNDVGDLESIEAFELIIQQK